MDDNLTFEIAHRHVHAFADQSSEVMRDHADAMNCRNCEEFLRAGIDACKWLKLTEETIREGAYLGIREITTDIRDALDSLYESWLEPCTYAEEWISSLEERGYKPDNLVEFRNAREEVRDIVERRDWQRRATTARVLSSQETWLQ